MEKHFEHANFIWVTVMDMVYFYLHNEVSQY